MADKGIGRIQHKRGSLAAVEFLGHRQPVGFDITFQAIQSKETRRVSLIRPVTKMQDRFEEKATSSGAIGPW